MIYNSVDVRISVKGQVWWGRGGGGIRTPRSLPMDPRLQLKCLSFVTHGEDLPEILVKPLPKNPTNSTYGWYASFKNAWVFPGISLVPRRPLLPHCLGKSRWVKSQLTEEFRIDWAENAWEPGITRGTTSCQRSQNVETLLTIQYHLSLRFHFRFRYLLLDLLPLRWTEKAWLESLPAVLDSTWKIRWQQKCQVMHESVEYDRPGEFLDTPAISTQLSTSFNYYNINNHTDVQSMSG